MEPNPRQRNPVKPGKTRYSFFVFFFSLPFFSTTTEQQERKGEWPLVRPQKSRQKSPFDDNKNQQETLEMSLSTVVDVDVGVRPFKQRRPTNRATFTVELVWPLKKKLVAVATEKKTSFFKQNWQRCSSVPIHQGIFEPRDPVTSSERVTSESALVKGKKTEQKTAGTRLVSREPIVSVFFSQCEPKQQFHPRLPHIRWPTKLGKTR